LDTININETWPEISGEMYIYRSGLGTAQRGASLPHFVTSHPDYYSTRHRGGKNRRFVRCVSYYKDSGWKPGADKTVYKTDLRPILSKRVVNTSFA
jgi:hypothetical protein